MSDCGASGLSVVLTQATSQPGTYLSEAQTYVFNLGDEDPTIHKPIDKDTVFRAGRLGQPILGYLILKLQDKGLFNVHQPLYKALPKPLSDYPEYADLANDSRFKRLTAWLVLTHQSGLINSRRARPDRRLVFERSPGGSFGYSDEGYRLLEFVLEQKFGQGINELAKSIVFDTLSMSQAGFGRQPRFEGHVAVAGRATPEGAEADTDESQTLYVSASDYNKFLWGVVICGGAFSDPYVGLPFHSAQVRITSRTIFDRPRSSLFLRDLPEGFGWSLGIGAYHNYTVGYSVKFIGQRGLNSECYATTVVRHAGGVDTSISIFIVGNRRCSVTGRILTEIIGEIDAPLGWLGFY